MFLPILAVLSILINSSIPVSLAQQEQVGAQENVTIAVKHLNQTVKDTTSTNEPTIIRTIDREKTLENQVNELKQDVQNADTRSALIGLAGIFASIVAYRLAKKDLKSVISQSVNETVQRTVEKTVEIANAQLRVKEGGKVAIRDNKIGADMTRKAGETVNAGESVSFVKKREGLLNEEVPVNDGVGGIATKAKDVKIVAENKKEFSVGAVLVNESDIKLDEVKNNKKEKKDDLSKGVKL